MKLTTKGRFAVTAMVDIAMRARESDAPVPIAQVAERQKISLAYLEQIFCRLRRAGLVERVRAARQAATSFPSLLLKSPSIALFWL